MHQGFTLGGLIFVISCYTFPYVFVLVANALDAAGLEEVAGTLAGDDTIFVALANGANPDAVANMLQKRRSGA